MNNNLYGLDDYLSIHLSKRCNLKCSHCYQTTYQSQTIDIEYIKKAINIFSPKWNRIIRRRTNDRTKHDKKRL